MAELIKRVEELENAVYGLSTELGESFEKLLARGTEAYVQTNNEENRGGHQQVDFAGSFPGQLGSRLQELQGNEVKCEKLQDLGTTIPFANDLSSTPSPDQSPQQVVLSDTALLPPMLSGLQGTATMMPNTHFNQSSASTMLDAESYYGPTTTTWSHFDQRTFHSNPEFDDVVDYS
ncbi:uncharacterized protein DSM5745_01971 [Aspergillus mulundensis]|uniref:Uncharacterized protein n=1 Tax=Aspergillus mulundensis TaxID=1810919 RepID=A0A3D8SV80_9EURO|nr:hypothetical protein DSM5745_01971 [Aspergillus mulundensis]RDW90196.1 hypothetical protein DSM5745_01971 [Aspergillus mulundensis]